MTPAKGFVQPKTEWGEPDLQGVWTSDAALGIPRERPEKFGTRAMLSDEEFAEAQKADEARRKGGGERRQAPSATTAPTRRGRTGRPRS